MISFVPAPLPPVPDDFPLWLPATAAPIPGRQLTAAASAAGSGGNQCVCHDLPEVFHLQFIHTAGAFYVFELTVAAVAWHHHDGGTGGLDLLHFPAAVMDPFFVVSVDQCTAATAAANLMLPVGIKFDPLFDALIQNPARLLVIAVSEQFLRFATVIAGIVVCDQQIVSVFVQPDALFGDVMDQQIEYGGCPDLLQQAGVVFFQTKPGRKIGMASLGPQEVFDVKHRQLLDQPVQHHPHGLIVPGKKSPVAALPGF